VQNLPFGAFGTKETAPRVGVAIGDHVVDMAALALAGTFGGLDVPNGVFAMSVLNGYLELGRPVGNKVRQKLSELLSSLGPPPDLSPGDFLVPRSDVKLLMPVAIGGYVDFYSSLQHATNVGRLFRPDEPPLPPN
jgi:fumarylacetoacetase